MSYLYKGKTGQWEVVIGLEVHCQITTKSKLFSSSSTEFGAEPNSNVSFIDAGYPGVLPRPNLECMRQAIKTGLAIGAKINLVSFFDRKHYFYPDNPLGYQITQFYKPIVQGGTILIHLEDGSSKSIGVDRIHVEQDAGKLLHEHHPTQSFVDLNRAGVGLMEIVSEPDLRSAEEACEYVSSLRSIVRYLETCDGNMDEGSMRCDINISVRHPGEEFRTRVEVKNVNSIRFMKQAIDYEVKQQVETWESGKEVVQATKLFNPSTGKTYTLREKEEAGDYRYIRDPDILPIKFTQEEVDEIKNSLPELPEAKKERFVSEYRISEYEASVLVSDKDYANFFEECLNSSISIQSPKTVASFVTTNLFAILKKESLKITESKVTPLLLAELVELIEDGTISTKIAKDVFEIIWEEQKSPKVIVEEKGLQQITDTTAIEAIVDDLVANNQDKVEQIKNGKDKLKGWFVGQIMKETQGKANPELINDLLDKKLN